MGKLGFLLILYTGSVLGSTSTEIPSRPKKMAQEDFYALFGNAKALRSQPSHKEHAVQLLTRFLNSESDDFSDERQIKKDLENEFVGISSPDLDVEQTIDWVDFGPDKRGLLTDIQGILNKDLWSPSSQGIKKKLASNEKREGADWYWSLQNDFNNGIIAQQKRAGDVQTSDGYGQLSSDRLETFALFFPSKALNEDKRSWRNPSSGFYAKPKTESTNDQNQRSVDKLETIATFWPAETLMEKKRSWRNPSHGHLIKSKSEGNLKSSNVQNQRSADQLETISSFWPAETLMENKRSWRNPPHGRQIKSQSEGNLKSSNVQTQRSADQLETIAMFWPAETLMENKRALPVLPQALQAESEIESKLDVINSALPAWNLKRSAQLDHKESRASSLKSEPMVVALKDWLDMDTNLMTRASSQVGKTRQMVSRSSRFQDVISKPDDKTTWSRDSKRDSKQALYDVLDQLATVSQQKVDKRDDTIVGEATDGEMIDPWSTFMRRSLPSKRQGMENIIAMLHSPFAKA